MASTQRLQRQPKRPSINSRAGVSRTVADEEFNLIEFDGEKVPAYVAMGIWYCRHVVAGNVPACLMERLGCQRFLDMLEQSKSPDCKYTFSPDHVTDFCLYFEDLPHIKGFDGTYVMEPVQCWWAAAIFGFRNRRTGLRWTRAAEIWIPRKNAKALALDTPIPTPTGWTTIGQIGIGDMVIGADGIATPVIDESPVFLKHDCYEVAFSNGDRMIADAGHRWLTTARVDSVGIGQGKALKKGGRMTRVRTTQEIFETQTYGARGDRNHSIQMPMPVEGEHRELPLDPYLMGAWIGDGKSDSSTIYCSGHDAPHFVEQIASAGYTSSLRQDKTCCALTIRPMIEERYAGGGAFRSTISGTLAATGAFRNKHIPPAYLRASREQRLALLQGLMDTDGTINKNGGCLSYSTSSKAIRDGFSELLATFGIKHSVRELPAVCNGKHLDTVHWVIQFFVDRATIPAFRLARKLDRMRPMASAANPRSRSVQITSVTKVDSVPTKCIAVGNKSHLFLAGRTMIPTHNTALAVGITLYCLTCEGESGAEGLVSAGSEKQANVPFKAILETIDLEPDLVEEYGIEKNKDEVFFTKVRADLKKLAGLAPNLDGLNPHVVLAEELHAQKQDVISVLRTAQAARRQPLFLTISTAGRSTASPAHAIFRAGQKILMGEQVADDVFILMYAADDGDALKRFDHKVLEKLNPLWGISLQEEAIGEEIRNALTSEANLQEYLRTRLNIWSKAAGTLFSGDDWDRCYKKDLDLDLMSGFPMYVGVDLASHSDLCAACFVVKVGDTLYAAFKLWIPEDSDRFNDDRFAADFRKWADEGHLTLTRGDHVDHEKILEDVLDMIEGHNVQGFAFDDWQADYLMGQTEKRGYQTFRVKKNPQHITRATDDLIARHRNKHLDPSVPIDASKHRLQHDGNPVAAWCVSNVVGHYDNNDNVLPKKEDKNSKRSIDGLDALVLANATRLLHEAGVIEDNKPKPVNHYLTHNLAGESE